MPEDPKHPYVVILAGGKGERFWPRSRTALPKQFLAILGPLTLLQQTYERAKLVTQPDRIFVQTADAYVEIVRRQLPTILESRIVREPVGKDTGPALALSAATIAQMDPDSVMVAVPADHLIGDDEAFAKAISRASSHALETTDLVLLGVRPSRPESAYGYIVPEGAHGDSPRPVRRFREKPGPEEALSLMTTEGALWNAGVFVFRVRAFLDRVQGLMPETYEVVTAMAAFPEDVKAELRFATLQAISVDYAVLEHTDGVFVVPADFLWDDVGNWGAVRRLSEVDSEENVLRGSAIAVDSRNTILDSTAGRLVVAFGVRDLMVVDSGDAVLVAPTGRAVDLKIVTETLRARGLGRYLDIPSGPLPAPKGSQVVDKPWGREIWWAKTDDYLAKILVVEAGQAFSLQYHEVKAESMFFLQGRGVLTLGDHYLAIEPGLTVDIPPNTIHRVEAEATVVLLEVSTAFPGDVVRLDDRYHRTAQLKQDLA